MSDRRGSSRSGKFADPGQKLPIPVGEHHVVEVELGVEVRVEGRLAEFHPIRQIAQGDGGEAVTAS